MEEKILAVSIILTERTRAGSTLTYRKLLSVEKGPRVHLQGQVDPGTGMPDVHACAVSIQFWNTLLRTGNIVGLL